MIEYEYIGKRYWSFLSFYADRFHLIRFPGTQDDIATSTFEQLWFLTFFPPDLANVTPFAQPAVSLEASINI